MVFLSDGSPINTIMTIISIQDYFKTTKPEFGNPKHISLKNILYAYACLVEYGLEEIFCEECSNGEDGEPIQECWACDGHGFIPIHPWMEVDFVLNAFHDHERLMKEKGII